MTNKQTRLENCNPYCTCVSTRAVFVHVGINDLSIIISCHSLCVLQNAHINCFVVRHLCAITVCNYPARNSFFCLPRLPRSAACCTNFKLGGHWRPSCATTQFRLLILWTWKYKANASVINRPAARRSCRLAQDKVAILLRSLPLVCLSRRAQRLAEKLYRTWNACFMFLCCFCSKHFSLRSTDLCSKGTHKCKYGFIWNRGKQTSAKGPDLARENRSSELLRKFVYNIVTILFLIFIKSLKLFLTNAAT